MARWFDGIDDENVMNIKKSAKSLTREHVTPDPDLRTVGRIRGRALSSDPARGGRSEKKVTRGSVAISDRYAQKASRPQICKKRHGSGQEERSAMIWSRGGEE